MKGELLHEDEFISVTKMLSSRICVYRMYGGMVGHYPDPLCLLEGIFIKVTTLCVQDAIQTYKPNDRSSLRYNAPILVKCEAPATFSQ